MSWTTKVIAGAGGLLLSLVAGTGIASAEPDVNAIVNSTCTYPQVMAALSAQDPSIAGQVSANRMATAWLQQLVASPPAGRRAMVAQAQGMPGAQQYAGLIAQVANTCNNY